LDPDLDVGYLYELVFVFSNKLHLNIFFSRGDDIAEEISKYDGIWNWESPQRIVWANDLGLVLKSKAKHAAISAPLRQPFEFKQDKPLVVQYEVTLQVRHLPNSSRIASAAGKSN